MYNPMLDYQRNQLLAQQASIQNQLNQLNNRQYNGMQFNPYPQSYTSQNNQFLVRQVTSIDEAKSCITEPNIMYLFTDTSTGRIYLKRLNTDTGKSDFFIYKIEETNEIQNVDDMKDIKNKLENIERNIGGLYESISSFTASDKFHEKSVRGDATADVTKNATTKSSNVQSSIKNDRK